MIGYAARVSWGVLAVRCAETLGWNADDHAADNRTVLGGRLPAATPEGIEWHSPAVKADGRWSPLGPGLATVILHEEAAGRIEWTCCCPAAQVVACVDGTRREGLGYAERLVMTLPPARLPIRELRWGRFIASTQNCVWIQWRGPMERSWCFHNGHPVNVVTSAGHELTWSGHRLEMKRRTTLRTGRIADTVFKDARLWGRLLPAAVGDVEETKWCSRGVLTDARGQSHEGWAVHEVAIFP